MLKLKYARFARIFAIGRQAK